jgi:hypothetical protein
MRVKAMTKLQSPSGKLADAQLAVVIETVRCSLTQTRAHA